VEIDRRIAKEELEKVYEGNVIAKDGLINQMFVVR